MRPHPGVKGSQVGELMPSVAGHLVEHRALAVNDLVVGEREHEVLVPGVKKPESQVVLVVPADKAGRSRSTGACRASSPCSTCNRTRARRGTWAGKPLATTVDSSAIVVAPGYKENMSLIELLQERHGFEVFVAPELVRHPFAGLPRVIEIEHGRHGVDPERVDVVLVGPKKGVRKQKIAYLVPAEVEHQRAPVGLGTHGAGVLVKVRPVKARQVRNRREGNGQAPSPR